MILRNLSVKFGTMLRAATFALIAITASVPTMAQTDPASGAATD